MKCKSILFLSLSILTFGFFGGYIGGWVMCEKCQNRKHVKVLSFHECPPIVDVSDEDIARLNLDLKTKVPSVSAYGTFLGGLEIVMIAHGDNGFNDDDDLKVKKIVSDWVVLMFNKSSEKQESLPKY